MYQLPLIEHNCGTSRHYEHFVSSMVLSKLKEALDSLTTKKSLCSFTAKVQHFEKLDHDLKDIILDRHPSLHRIKHANH